MSAAEKLSGIEPPDRAEFIRVQVRLAGRFRGCDPICNQETGHGRHCEHDLRDELRRRERDLWPGAVFHLLDALRPTAESDEEPFRRKRAAGLDPIVALRYE